MKPLVQVSVEDCGRLQGTGLNPLEVAITEVCPGITGNALWERVRDDYKLGIGMSCEQWVIHMNIAIGIWNASDPKTCEEIKKAFGV